MLNRTSRSPRATMRMRSSTCPLKSSKSARDCGNQTRGENGCGNVSKMVLLSELAAHLESGRLRITNTPMGQELISELNSFEVDFTSAGNMRVDVRSKDHHGTGSVRDCQADSRLIDNPGAQGADHKTALK